MAATRGVLLYLLSGFSLAIVLAYFINDYSFRANANTTLLILSSSNSAESSEAKVWPELKFGWRLVLASVIGFLGSACGSVGGIGGGGIFVPMLNLLLGFDTKSAAAISKCMIMGACTSSVWYNLRVAHPFRQVPIIDYDLALLFQPMLMLGITIGVSLSVVFPYWLITVLIIILFMGTSTRSLSKGIGMWKKETISKKAMEEYKRKNAPALTSVVIDAHYVPLAADKDETITMEKTTMQIVRDNLNMNRIMVLLLVWSCFLLLQIIKNGTKACSPLYWFLNLLQLPIALALTGYICVKLYKESKRRRIEGNLEPVCEAAIEWTPTNLVFCAFCGVVGGTVGGLLGSGGGFVLGPLLLEIKVIPQVASATSTFVMMFSASLSVVEFYLLDRFPMPYALYLMGVSILAGFGGQYVVSKIVAILKRPSIIVFILSSVISVSAVVMGVVGIQKSITKINNHEFMANAMINIFCFVIYCIILMKP